MYDKLLQVTDGHESHFKLVLDTQIMLVIYSRRAFTKLLFYRLLFTDEIYSIDLWRVT